MLTIKSTLRHPNFDEKLDSLELQFSRARQIIDGAIWEIERDPEGLGVYIEELDVWQARVVAPHVLLVYTIPPRFVYMLTIIAADESISL